MRRLARAFTWGVGGYLAAAFAGYWLVSATSSNTHDLSIEAAMTSAFVIGPLGGLLAAVIGFARHGRAANGSRP